MRPGVFACFLFSSGILFTCWFYAPYAIRWLYHIHTETLAGAGQGQITIEKLGTFGDSFGVLNTLFSGLAFLGVAFSVWLQKKELDEARKQLAEERLHRDKASFETTFINLLGLYTQGASALKYECQGKELEGNAAFDQLATVICSEFYDDWFYHPQRSAVAIYEEKFSKRHHKILGHYFRTLYHVLKFIEQSSLSDDEKKFYSNILRSQLTSSQLLLLFYNGLSKYGDKLKPLLISYKMFEQLPGSYFNEQIKKESFNQYDICAFGDSQEIPADWKSALS